MKTKILEQTQSLLIKELTSKLDEKDQYILHKIVELENKITNNKK